MSARALTTLPLPEGEQGAVPVTAPGPDGQELTLAVLRGGAEGWRLTLAEGCRAVELDKGVRTREERQLPLQPGCPVNLQAGRELVRLLPEAETPGRGAFVRYELPGTGVVQVGGGAACAVQYTGFGCEAAALELRCEGGRVTAVNLHTVPWNLYRNGRGINTAPLEPGDRLYCAGLRLLIGPGFLAVDRAGEGMTCRLAPYAGPRFFTLPAVPEHDVVLAPAPAAPLRPQAAEIRVQPPPAEPAEPENSGTLLAMLPGAMMAVAMLSACLLSLSGSGGSVMTLASSLIMVVSMGVSCLLPVFQRRSAARARQARRLAAEADYRAYLERLEERIRSECRVERFNLLQRNPPLEGEEQALPLPEGKGSLPLLSCAGRSRMNGWKGLWERKPDDPDFLQVAVGVGDLPPVCRILKPDPPQIGPTPALYEEMERRLADAPVLQNVPVTLDLRAHRLAGIVGNDRQAVCRAAVGLLVELTALHACDDLRIVVIHGEAERGFWEFARWMPHIWRPDGEARLLANDVGEIKALSQYLEGELARREDKENRRPGYVILDADEALSGRAEAVRRLCAGEKDTGMTLIQLRTATRQLTRSCTAILNADSRTLELRQGSTARLCSLRELALFGGDALALFRNMYHIRPAGADGGTALPRSLTFLDMLQTGSTAQLDIPRRWRESDPVHSLRAMIGRDRDGFPIWLDVHEKAHGPHGLVAGMTGSGKSEFLISYVLAMAASYRPDEVAFVLIDFKGGGMADVFRGLPHLVGSITNLDGGELRRSFLAIESELERRQTLIQQAARELGVGSLDIYSYQECRRQGRVRQPLPHLILIADEFAELKLQQGDFMDQLIRIARIGRSLGVHLILATQKPDGVVSDQIRSNIRFKVCLKVQSRGDSQSVIGVPDAAAIACAGRFYYQVGFNEVFELGQSGYSGAPYREKERYEPPRDRSVELLSEQGVRLAGAAPVQPDAKGAPRQAAAVLRAVEQAAEAEGLVPVPLWEAPIPTVTVRRAGAAPVLPAPRVGCYDDLYARRHPPLTVPLEERGSALVYGAAGSGKAAFVERLLMSCMELFTPEQMQFWLADGEAGSLQAFREGSHTAWLSMPGEYTACGEMLDRLNEELETRRQRLRPFGGERQRLLAAGQTMPLLLLVVHELTGFLSGSNADRLLDGLRELARVGRKYGLVLLVTATDSRSVHYSLKSLFPQVFVLRLTGDGEYDELLGRTGGLRPADGLGRGLVRVEDPRRGAGMLCEFQVDVPFADQDNPYDALCAFVREKSAGRSSAAARLPEVLDPAFFERFACGRTGIPVAATRKGEPVAWNFFEDPLLVASLPRDPALARGLARLLRRGCGGDLLVLDGTGAFGAAEGCRVVTGAAEMAAAVEEYWNSLCAAVERDNAHYEATGRDLEEPGLGLLVCGADQVAAALPAAARADLDEILRYRNGHLLLVRAVLCGYEDGVVSRLAALNEAGRPAPAGLALEVPERFGQSLFACRELTGKSPFGGLVRGGELTPCGFARA